MKSEILFLLTAVSLTVTSCSGFRVTSQDAKMELNTTAASISKDKSLIYKLDNRSFGNKGYYYILRNNGTISYHPKKALINSDFSRFPFIQKILKERNGCFYYKAEGILRYIFFTEINKDEILCLTVDSTGFTGPAGECTGG